MKLREARLIAGCSTRELATALGVTRRTIERWERGRNMPTGLNLLRLHKVLDIEIDEWEDVKHD